MPGTEHVGKGQQRRHQSIVFFDVDRDQSAVGLGNTHRLSLATVDVRGAPEAVVQTGSLESFLAEVAGAVRKDERGDHYLAGLDRFHI